MKLRQWAQYALVTAVTLIIWLFAEAESVSQTSLAAQVRLTPTDDWYVEALPRQDGQRWGGDVTVELRGSTNALSRARELLAGGRTLFFSPGAPGLARRSGEQTVSLRELIQNHPRLIEAGVTVDAVRPAEARMLVQELVQTSAPVAPELAGVSTTGPIVARPDDVAVRIRADVLAAFGGTLPPVPARPTTESLAALDAGPATLTAELRLPTEVRDAAGAGVLLVQKTVELSFEVRSIVECVPAQVPVWVRLPAIETGRYLVEIAENDRVLRADLEGSPEALQAFRTGADAIVATLALDSAELAITDVQSKAVVFGTRSGRPLPRDVEVRVEDAVVDFAVRPAPMSRNDQPATNGPMPAAPAEPEAEPEPRPRTPSAP